MERPAQRHLAFQTLFSLYIFYGIYISQGAVHLYEPNLVDPLLEPWRWTHIEALDGLGFQCMAQEPNETMWFGLKEGIIRYDGIHWHRFNLDDGLTPLSKMILSTEDGRIYLQTSQAIHLYQNHSWNTIIYQSYQDYPAQSMAVDAQGGIWAACREGLIYIQDNQANLVERIEGGLTTVFIDSRNQLWCLPTDYRAVHRVSLGEGRLEPITKSEHFPLYTQDRKRQGSILETTDGRIWIASDASSEQVHIYDPNTQSWTNMDLGTTLSRYTCTSLAQTKDDVLWLIGQGQLHAWQKGESRIYTSPDLKISSSRSALLAAADGSLWIGGMTDQVYRIDYSHRQYITYQDLHFQCESPPGTRWFLTNSGSVIRQDVENDRWQHIDFKENLPDAPVVIIASRDGSVWVAGSHQGDAAVSRFNGKIWSRHIYPQLAFSISPYSVLETASGDMLFGSASHRDWDNSRQGGLLRFFRSGSTYQSDHLTYPLVPFRIVGIAQTQEGFWFGGSYLACFDGDHTRRMQTPVNLAMDWVDDVKHSPNNHLWVAKGGDGIFHYNEETWQQYTLEQGLASNMVSCLSVGPDNTLWAGTDVGISRFDGVQWQSLALPEAFTIDRECGNIHVSSNGAVWINQAPRQWYFRALDPNERVWGSDDPFVTTRYQLDKQPPNTHINFSVSRIPAAAPIQINWTGRDAWFVTSNDQLTYSYRLDKGAWSAFTPQTSQTWLDLSSGKHVFEVRARDRDLNIDPTPANIAFTVMLPTWRQPWFILVIGSLLLAIALLIARLIRIHEAHITQQLRFEKQQAQHQLEIDESRLAFFTNISHELRTPLTLITGPLETLLSKLQDVNLKDQAQLAKRNADRLLQLVNQLLDIRKLQAGKLQLRPTKTDLIGFTRGIIATLESAAQQKELTLNCKAEETQWMAVFDIDKLEKILVNLISNAIKFTNMGGGITVYISTSDTEFELTVEDNGIGIPKDQLDKVFERFHRLDKEGTTPGSGIGLSLTHELVQLHGGNLRVESPVHPLDLERPGTRFIVTIPQKKTSIDLKAIPDQKEGDLETDAPPIIQIVEDNIDMRHYIGSILKLDYQLLEAADGQQGLQLAQENMPDLIISDIMMPEMNGIELCRILKNNENTSHIPIILLTAKGSEEAQVEGLETGADAYIIKPFSQTILKSQIVNLLESRRRLQTHFQNDSSLQLKKIAINPIDERFLKRALEIVEAHLSDYDFSMDIFSAKMHMSRSTLYRKVKALTGQSPSVFIRTVRLKHAAKLLKIGNNNISEVAYQVGFLDMTYFSTCFKQQFQCTPSQFITQNKQ